MSEKVIREFEHEGEQYLVIGWYAPRPVALADLTAAEIDVAMAWVEGVDARTLAHARGVSAKTIFNQVRAIYDKVGVGSRQELLEVVRRTST